MSSLNPQPKPKKSRKPPRYLIVLIIFVFIIGVIAFNLPLNTTQAETRKNKTNMSPIDAAKQFNSQNAIDFAGQICGLGPRYGGNDAELKAADMFEAELKKYDIYTTKEKVDLGDGKYTYNVIGKIEGTTNPDRYIIIGSHIDSPQNAVGANDGASGQGIQVEMARILSNVNTNKTILIVGFGAEMLWFKGSEAFVNNHPDILKNCDAMIDLNVVGAGENVAPIAKSDLPEVVVADYDLLNLLKDCADELGHPLVISEDAYPSDTYYFYKYSESKVPVVQIESRPFKVPAWSKENTPDKLDPNDMNRVGQTVTMAVLKLSNSG
ncbi:MAG TPA: M28 family peptidase [Methanobacterium sp.]|nr:M28 family peptidase [Methanobacterium sp.]